MNAPHAPAPGPEEPAAGDDPDQRLRALEAENARLRETVLALSESTTGGPAAHAAGDGDAEHFRIMADNIPQLAWMADRTGWLFWFNKRWHDYTGATLDDMQGWGWKAVHHPDHVDRVVQKFADALESGEPWEDTFPLRSAKGEYRWFLSRAAPIKDQAGEVIRWFGTNTDITEQLRTEATLRAAEEGRRMATEAAEIGAWDYHPRTRSLHWDARCREIFGADPDGPVSVELLQERVHPDDRERVLATLRRAMTPDEDPNYLNEYRIIHGRTGEERWLSSRGRAWFEDGEAVRLVGTVLDITERKVAEHHQILLINELNHRVKNTLATVQAMASRTLRSAPTPEAALDALNARLMALSKAHDILTAENWEGAEMADMVGSALAPYRETACGRFDISGPVVRISPKKALALSMALHELATNATKYGALSGEEGRVSVEWDWYRGQAERRLRLCWRESGGPPVESPARQGFGTRLITDGLAGQLNAEVELDYRPAGVWCTIDAPLLHVDRKTPR